MRANFGRIKCPDKGLVKSNLIVVDRSLVYLIISLNVRLELSQQVNTGFMLLIKMFKFCIDFQLI